MDKRAILAEINKNKVNYDFQVNLLDKLLSQKEDIQKTIKVRLNEKETTENMIYANKLLLEKLVNVSKSNLEQFLTFALSKIFTDRDYQVRLDLKEDSKRPGLELVLVENGISQSITDAVGGGILSTLGLLLQIYYIEVYNLNKTMFIDEGLKEISKADPSDPDSKDYLKDVLNFLKWLSVERGYTFVIVTHDQGIVDTADQVYKVKKGRVTI